MSDFRGRFVWHELMTSDTRAATAFYTDVIGWTIADSGMPGLDYLIASAGKDMVAGIMEMPPHAAAGGAKPAWLGYVAVDEVDIAAVQLSAHGGTLHRAPEDIPGVGRFAVVSDPHGAVFCLFHSTTPDGEAAKVMAPGHVGWNELMCDDPEEAMAFYQRLFHWQKDTALDMGPLGTYQMFAVGGHAIGGMMRKPPELPGPIAGSSISPSKVSMRPASACAPVAARCSISPWKCPAAPGSSPASTRRAHPSRWSR